MPVWHTEYADGTVKHSEWSLPDKVSIIGPFHWRDRYKHPCQALCESAHWWYRKYGKFPACKHSACFKYKGKQYCQIHMGVVLIKEKLEKVKEKDHG